ncbi:type II secretion system protein GspL [Mameliella sp.]|uniref:type II secretion system protein GspL n=1 Tax=Mameliella sp. TaxID=1924940 RepID=UPI003BA8F47A
MADLAEFSPVPTDPGLATAPVGGPVPRGRYVALVPGEAVPLVALDLPGRLRGVAREQVAQRQLSDLLGPEAGALQMRPFALDGNAEGWTRVLVVERAALARWREQVGKGCVAVLPDYLALPVDESSWTVAGTPERVRARFGPADGVTTTETALCLQAEAIMARDGAPDRVWRYGPPLPEFEAWLTARDIPLVEGMPDKGADLRAFSRGETGLDLRADPQAARRRLRRQLSAWCWPVLTGAVAAGLWAAAQIAVIRATEAETAALTARATELTRAEFIPSGPILDMRVQIARALAEQRSTLRGRSGRVSPLDLFAGAAPVLSGAGARLETVAWAPEDGLQLVLDMGDFAAVDALVDSLAAEGLRITVRDARLGEEGNVTADLTIREPEQGG